MARIRSVHPSLFTDEAWVQCSPLARVLYIGLLTDADDQGLFEWKPLQIKMRLLPGDNTDVTALLAELSDVDLIKPFEGGGKKLGAVRKFRRFQRPKKPNALFVLPAEFRTYVGLDEDSSELDDDEGEPVPHLELDKGEAVPQKAEIGAQMEDGGWRMEKDSLSPDSDAQPVLIPEEPRQDHVRQAFDLWNDLAKRLGLPTARNLDDDRRRKIRGRLSDGGLEAWSAALQAVERSKHCRGDNDRGWRADLDFVCQPKSWRRLLEGFYGSDAKASVTAPAAPADPLELWRRRVREFKANGFWNTTDWGARPGRDGCGAPAKVLAEFGFPNPNANPFH